MKIILTAPLEEKVPPAKYGGTELIVYLLAKEYVALGHEVYLLASGDSRTPAHLVPILPQSIRSMEPHYATGEWRDYWKYLSTARVIEEIYNVEPDIIHDHMGTRLIAFANLIRTPMISTVHGPITSIREKHTLEGHPEHAFVSISDNQRRASPDTNWIGTVYNGIDIDKFPINRSPSNRDYFAFLGRTSPEKGLAEIVQMIKKTPYQLKIAAKVDDVDSDYFKSKVEPYIDGKQIQFIGEVNHVGKVKLLKRARALLLWLNWEEPFGLVVPEANACGTPVIVNRRGSMPEIVKEGVNGFLVNSLQEMKKRLDNISTLDPETCRAHVSHNFTSRIMASKYLDIMHRLLSNR